MPNMPNLRTWEPGPPAKKVEDTKLLNTKAKEAADTVTANNENKEYTEKHPNFGQLGARGRS